jgi:glycine cleavage system H protein
MFADIDDCVLFSRHDIWIKVIDSFTGICGITEEAQERIGNVVFINLPENNLEANKGLIIGSIESYADLLKIVSPVSGNIMAVNTLLEEAPELINNDPLGEGWIFKIDVKFTNELRDLYDYEAYIAYLNTQY